MKKLTSLLICALLILSIVTNYAFADGPVVKESTSIIYLEDGNYFEVRLLENSSAFRTNSKSGSKTYTYYDHGSAVWAVILNATFTFDGSSATCTSASCSVAIYSNFWYTVSSGSSISGNTAIGTASVAHRLLGITVQTIPVSITLSCDANGNLS